MSTAAPALSFSDVMDLILVALERAERERGPGNYFDLNAIAKQFKDPIPFQWIFDAAKVLESRGLARCLFTFGAVQAQLTGEGRLFVEQRSKVSGSIVEKFEHNPGQFVVISGDHNQVAVGTGDVTQTMDVERERWPVFEQLLKIEKQLKADGSLGDEERRDLLADVESIRGQLRKREPNRNVLAALLEPLSHVASIGSFVGTLIQLINS